MKSRLDPPGICDFWAFFPCPQVFSDFQQGAQAIGGGSSQIFFGPKLPYVSRQKLFFLDFWEAPILDDTICFYNFSALNRLF